MQQDMLWEKIRSKVIPRESVLEPGSGEEGMQPKSAAALISALGSNTAISISHALRQKEEALVGWYTMATATLRQPSAQQASLLLWPRDYMGQNSKSSHEIYILLDIPHHPGAQTT